ncbi:MAG: alpha/beta hydrolase [Anaerolineae bacterium]|jgi:pimeloyl-ACP methyl ester carboxylesterase|nr:alpha/beta hydrolase [Anaerolineae bacterium]
MIPIILLVAVLLAASAPIVATAQTPTPTAQGAAKTELYTAEVIPCPSDIINGSSFTDRDYAASFGLTNLNGEVEGKTMECGLVTVPEDYSKPDGRRLELFYMRLFSTSKSPAADPLIYLSGGPGIAGVHEVATNAMTLSNLNQIRERRDVVTFDQRGTGYSNYLICAPFTSAVGMLLERNTDEKVAAQFKAIENEVTASVALKNNLCAAMYGELTDVDLGQYNSVASAQDIRHLADALGYSEGYNLYGTSYGTRLAQYTMRAAPEQVRSVVLDGALAPNQANSTMSFAKRYEQYLNIFAQCAADSACNAAYPNLKERFAALLKKIEANPIALDPPLVVNPEYTWQSSLPAVIEKIDPSFFFGLAGLSNGFPNGGPANLVPRTILALEKGDLDYVRSTYGVAQAPAAAAAPAAPVAPPPAAQPAFQAEQPLFQAPFSTLVMFAQALAAGSDSGIDTHWLAIALNDLQARLTAGEDQVDLMEDLITLSVVPNMGADAQNLIDYANEHLSAEAAKAANAVVAQMSNHDVRKTLWGIQDIAMNLGGPESRANSSTLQFALNCAEDTAFTTPEEARAYLKSSPFPQLVLFSAETNDMLFKSCEFYPKPLDKSVIQPVKSDIPTLVFQSALDVQTPLSWAQPILKTLNKGYYAEWSNLGHVVAGHDYRGCAGDIAAAFVDNPGQQPNITCSQSEDYKLKFELPK